MKQTTLSFAAVALLATSSFAASDVAGMFKEGKASGQVRAMYIGNDYKSGGPVDNSALGVGGKLKFETASLAGVSAGAAFYTVNDFGTKSDTAAKVDPYTFSESTNSYSLLGEAYLAYSIGKTTIKVGRQQIDSPLAGSDDIRVVPNLFEAALVINTDLPDTTLIGGHITRMAGLDSVSNKAARTQFQSMSRAALGAATDAGVEDRGVTAVAAVYSGVKDLTLQVWDYYAWEVLNAIYAQADYKMALSKDMGLALSGQFYNEQGLGKTKDLLNSLGAGSISYSVYGAKAALGLDSVGLTPYLAYNKVGENKNNGGGSYTFGAWGGYPEFAIGEETWYNTISASGMNGAQVWKLGADYNMEKIGLGARTFGVAYSSFDLKNQYNKNTDADTGVWDFVLSCNGALVKNLDAKIIYEMADSKSDAFDRKTLKAVFNYSF